MSSTPGYVASHFGWKHRAITAVSQALDGITYTQRHGLISGMRRRGGLGFLPEWLVGSGGESQEQAFLRGLDLRGLVVYDVGAFHGLLTLHFARTARQVVSFEPNPSSRERLLQNVALNRLANVRVVAAACGREAGTLELCFESSFAGGASADAGLREQIVGTSPDAKVRRTVVPVVRLDDAVRAEGLPAPDLVKIDVEGLELAVLEGMAELLATARPRLYLEMHGSTAEDKAARVRQIVEYLAGRGYTAVQHVESGAAVTPENSALAREGHLYCAHGASVGAGAGAGAAGGALAWPAPGRGLAVG